MSLLEGAEKLPGVTAAALCQRPPIVRGGMRSTLSRVGGPPGTPEDNVEILIVTPRYFETLGLPILAGRGLNPGGDSEMVLNDVAARHFFGTGSALGATFNGLGRGKPAMTVVGVAASAKMRSLRETHRPAAYVPLSGHDFPRSRCTCVPRAIPRSSSRPCGRSFHGSTRACPSSGRVR
jgi:hypothetical protein